MDLVLQTHYFSENVVAPGIEPGPLDLPPGTLPTRPQRQSQAKGKLCLSTVEEPERQENIT
jgi:hypothetical protein